MVSDKEVKELASKYLGRLYSDLVDVREHIAGSAEKWTKSQIREGLIRVNNRHDIAGVEQLKDKWFKLVDKFEKLPEEIKIDRQRIEVDQLACDLANEIIHKQRQLREVVE